MIGFTPLHLVAETGRLDIAKLLLESGADANIRDDDGQTPFDIASDEGNHEVASSLSGRMEATMYLDGVVNPTSLAIKRQNRSPKAVASLQKSGEEVNPSENEQPSLYTASENGQLDIVRSFLDNINATYKNRVTALHAASSKGKLEVVKLLIDREVARLLLDYGAYVSKTRNDGNALPQM